MISDSSVATRIENVSHLVAIKLRNNVLPRGLLRVISRYQISYPGGNLSEISILPRQHIMQMHFNLISQYIVFQNGMHPMSKMNFNHVQILLANESEKTIFTVESNQWRTEPILEGWVGGGGG